MRYLLQQGGFVFRFRYISWFLGICRKYWYALFGMKIGKNTTLPRLYITWPHQVSIGKKCILEHNTYFKYDGVWRNEKSITIGDNIFIGSGCEFNIKKGIVIGNDSLIASGCRFIDHDHGIGLEALMRIQEGPEKEITIGRNVWLGCNVVILKGVEIGDGAIIAAGAVVTKSVSANEIWAGVPAKKIGERK